MNAIISASELADDLTGDNPPSVLDVRWQLSVAKAAGEPSFDGRAEYAAGHIPGAVFVDLDRELAATPGTGGRHPLPDLTEFGAAMRGAGVSSGTPVVVYDGGQGWAAARAWWMLRWTGHPDVRVLDGGLPSWPDGLSTDTPEPAEGDFRPRPDAVGLLDPDGAAALARSGVLLDARAGSATGARSSRSTGSAATSRARSRRPPRRTWRQTAASFRRRNWPPASRRWACPTTRRSASTAAQVSPAHTRYSPWRSRASRPLCTSVPGRSGRRTRRVRWPSGPIPSRRTTGGPAPTGAGPPHRSVRPSCSVCSTRNYSCFFRRVPNTISSQLGTAARRPGRTPSASAWRSVEPTRRSRWPPTERGMRTSA